MALTVNTNVSALNAQRATMQSQNEMASAMERLATGKRINSAVDDAAGLAIAARMESQISGLNQAVRNANDAISLVQTAEGALQETTGILQRIRELAIQSAGGAPSNADRVNLNKEVIQLQEELARIANTTRFNGGLLLNGSFVDTDFQIGQSNNEEITVSIGDVRPERIGAYTQRTVDNVGLVTSGAALNEINNGVQQQTLVLQVGTEIPRTVAINQGDDARTISDKMNQAGAQINSTAVTRSNVYIDGYGSFSFKLSSSSTADIQDVITVGATAGSQAAALAAEVNRGFSEHNISASIKVDDNGVEYVEMLQDDGYDIMIEDYVTTGDSTLDFDMDGEAELTGAYGKTAAVVGGSITIDAPASFLISSDDELNTILQGTRASFAVTGVNNDPAAYQDASFDVTVNGVTKTINLAAPPPAEPLPAASAVAAMEFTATAQTQGSSGAQIGALRAQNYTIGTITSGVGDLTMRFSLNVNGNGARDLDMAPALEALGYASSATNVTPADFVSAMQTTIDGNAYFSGNNAVSVSLTTNGQIQLDVAGGSGTIVFAEHSGTGSNNGLAETLTGAVANTSDTGTSLTAGGATESSLTGTLVLGAQANAATSSDFGPVKPFGIANRTITNGTNDSFTLAINGGAPTTIDVVSANTTYYSMEEMATAVQAAIDNSPFASTGSFPITVEATQDENGDWGLTFASVDGHSIQLGGGSSSFIESSAALNVSAPSTTPDIASIAEKTLTITGIGATPADNATTRFSINVNGGGAIDIGLASYLSDAGVGASDTTVTEDQFVEALQAALDAQGYFVDDNAVTVSVTDSGLIRLDVAGGAGTIVVAEHSQASTNNGLAETLTGAVANTVAVGSSLSAGGATQTGTGGFIVLGQQTNDATATATVKTFGITPVTVPAATDNALTVAINGGNSTTLTIPAAQYLNMQDIAAAVQTEIDSSPQLSGSLSVTAVQNSTSGNWGLSFSNPDGYAISISGDFVNDALSQVDKTIPAVGAAPSGPAASRTSVDAGAYSNGIDLSTDNTVVVEVIDNETGTITSKTITLDSSSDSVSFGDFASYLEAAGNSNFLDEGYTFTSSGSGTSYSMTLEPAGDYTVSFSGTSITQAFGGPVSATGTPSNMDGLTFESMDDVVAELNAQLAANGIDMAATYTRGGDTFNFAVTSGPADASSTISMSGDDLVDLGFTGSLSAIGGGVHRTEEVRYVSQIDISTRESASLAMTVVDAALETLASVRGGLGAVANRLESTISNLMNISENTSASMSRVMDADFAAESTRLARAQILQETSISMLAQANAAAQSVLKLLQ